MCDVPEIFGAPRRSDLVNVRGTKELSGLSQHVFPTAATHAASRWLTGTDDYAARVGSGASILSITANIKSTKRPPCAAKHDGAPAVPHQITEWRCEATVGVEVDCHVQWRSGEGSASPRSRQPTRR